MRYQNVPVITFTDSLGRTFPVREMREIPRRQTAFVVARAPFEPFDLVASRPDVFGDGGERRAWELHDAMAVEIVDRLFDYSLITSVRVPQ